MAIRTNKTVAPDTAAASQTSAEETNTTPEETTAAVNTESAETGTDAGMSASEAAASEQVPDAQEPEMVDELPAGLQEESQEQGQEPIGKQVMVVSSKKTPLVSSKKTPLAVCDPQGKRIKDRLDPETVGNTFPRIVAAAGNLRTNSNIPLGNYVDLQVVSVSDRWMMAPVADMKTDPDSKFFCRVSYDGETIPDREGGPSMTFAQWEAEAKKLRIAGKKQPYAEWKITKYMDIYGIIFNADPKFKETAVNLGLIQMSISTTAIKAFVAYFMQAQLNVSRGLIPAGKHHCMRISAEAKSNARQQDYTIMVPSLVPAEIIKGYTPAVLEL